MATVSRSQRARGSTRGGCGGGYEQTDPNWDATRARRLRDEYDSLDEHWQRSYLKGLSRYDRWIILNREER